MKKKKGYDNGFNIRLSEEDKKKLIWNAKMEKTTKSALIRDYINQDFLVKKAEKVNNSVQGILRKNNNKNKTDGGE